MGSACAPRSHKLHRRQLGYLHCSWPLWQGLDFFGGTPLAPGEAVEAAMALAGDEDDRIVFLSDLWLDRPATLDRLRAVLAGALPQEPVSEISVI